MMQRYLLSHFGYHIPTVRLGQWGNFSANYVSGSDTTIWNGSFVFPLTTTGTAYIAHATHWGGNDSHPAAIVNTYLSNYQARFKVLLNGNPDQEAISLFSVIIGKR